MIALDTNILVYAHRRDSRWHEAASRVVRELAEGRVTGPRIHDARIAALCLHHGVRELSSADRDFSRFPRLATRNPLLGS
jgi:predicted nucleic acid-binding protein